MSRPRRARTPRRSRDLRRGCESDADRDQRGDVERRGLTATLPQPARRSHTAPRAHDDAERRAARRPGTRPGTAPATSSASSTASTARNTSRPAVSARKKSTQRCVSRRRNGSHSRPSSTGIDADEDPDQRERPDRLRRRPQASPTATATSCSNSTPVEEISTMWCGSPSIHGYGIVIVPRSSRSSVASRLDLEAPSTHRRRAPARSSRGPGPRS